MLDGKLKLHVLYRHNISSKYSDYKQDLIMCNNHYTRSHNILLILYYYYYYEFHIILIIGLFYYLFSIVRYSGISKTNTGAEYSCPCTPFKPHHESTH